MHSVAPNSVLSAEIICSLQILPWQYSCVHSLVSANNEKKREGPQSKPCCHIHVVSNSPQWQSLQPSYVTYSCFTILFADKIFQAIKSKSPIPKINLITLCLIHIHSMHLISLHVLELEMCLASLPSWLARLIVVGLIRILHFPLFQEM